MAIAGVQQKVHVGVFAGNPDDLLSSSANNEKRVSCPQCRDAALECLRALCGHLCTECNLDSLYAFHRTWSKELVRLLVTDNNTRVAQPLCGQSETAGGCRALRIGLQALKKAHMSSLKTFKADSRRAG